jgi:hypothetical protein
VNFSRMWGSRGIGDHPQHPLQRDEAREDDCSYSDDTNGTVNITHDVQSPLSSLLGGEFHGTMSSMSMRLVGLIRRIFMLLTFARSRAAGIMLSIRA